MLVILIIAGLLGAILIMNYSKENLTENRTVDVVENTFENNETCEGEDCEIEKLDDEDIDEREHFSDDHEHDHSVEIEGSEIKRLTIQEVANLWEINSEELLGRIILEFSLEGNYTTGTTLEYIRDEEYKFSPAIIKDIAEEIKQAQ